jgi:hypothetical protein
MGVDPRNPSVGLGVGSPYNLVKKIPTPDVVAECVKIHSFFIILYLFFSFIIFSYISCQTTFIWTQELDFTVNFTLGHHWRRHCNSTGMDVTHLWTFTTLNHTGPLQDTGKQMTS